MTWENVKPEIKDDVLILKINLKRRIRRSNPDKSWIISETGGYELIPGTNNLRISLFVYEPD